MKHFKSIVNFSSKYNDDVWNRIFRFNKCVKAFKYISFSSSPALKRVYQKKFRIDSNYYYRRTKASSPLGMLNKVNPFGRRLWGRHKLQYFYGKLAKPKFRRLLSSTKGKVAYARVNYVFRKFEFRIDITLFRAGWFTETLTPFQLVFHGFASVNGRISKSPFELINFGYFVTLSDFVFNRRDILRRLCLKSGSKPKLKPTLKPRKFVFPCNYMIVSEYLPALIIWRFFNISSIKIFPRINKFEILKYNY